MPQARNAARHRPPRRVGAEALRSLRTVQGLLGRSRRRIGGAEGLRTTAKDATEQHFAARTVLWTAGVEAVPFARSVAAAFNADADRVGRLIVKPNLTIAGHSNVYIIGDLANLNHLPGVAEVAMQGGQYAASSIRRRQHGP